MPFATLPPLHFLRAVEAAARLGSFRAAAEELHLTPSAVSQQIHAVEEALRAPLFVRAGRAVTLTPEGRIYCQDVRRILLELADAGRRLAARASDRVVRLTTVDHLALEFLIPRLPAFEERFPGIELRIETSMRVLDLYPSELDAALRVRGRAGPGLCSEAIGPATATPVCSIDMARRLRSPADLARATLIELRSAEGSWDLAFRRYGIDARPSRVLSFESYLETLTAAERGLGVSFGVFPMSTSWVTQQRLAVPFSYRTPLDGGIYLVFRENESRRELLVALAAWLRSEYANLPALPDGRVVPKKN